MEGIAFLAHIPNMDTQHLILGGDMNCTLSPILDCSSSKIASKSNAAAQLQLFLKTNGIADAWSFQNPTARSYSVFL